MRWWGKLSWRSAKWVLTASCPVSAAPGPCLENEFQCGDGTCVLAIKRCNQERDCLDGSDEAGCLQGACDHSKGPGVREERPVTLPGSERTELRELFP